MFRVRQIEAFDLPELQPYRTMRRQQEHRDQGIFVAEGEKVVRRLLESRFTVVSLLLPEKWLASFEPLLNARTELVEVFVAEKKLLETLTGFSMYQGLLAVGKIPPAKTLDEILQGSSRPHLLVAVDGLSSAENLGALVRNCVAFHVGALIVGETSGSPFLRRAVRNSMGTVFQLPVLELPTAGSQRHRAQLLRQPLTRHLPNTGEGLPVGLRPADAVTLEGTLSDLRERGIRCIAAHPHIEGRTLTQADFTVDCCIVFGSEGSGISGRVLELCDDAVAIPMPATVDSLNVGAAAAVFFYEANRQRGRVRPM